MAELSVPKRNPVDGERIETWVRTHGPMVLGYLIKLCGNRDRAEDCFQETFRRALEKADQVNPETIQSWLYRVATNVAMDGFRKRSRQCRVLAPEQRPGDEASDPAEAVAQSERIEAVRHAVASLPDRQRTVLVLSYYQKQSYREIAALLDCSLGTVKTHMSRALATLAQRLPAP
jgi:RNA polymerase sigma-70 factor (ECF subfamily)